jgi:hypothetical protein
MRLEVALARDPDSVATARSALGEVFDHLTPRRLEDARLLVSELVIEVCDSGPGFELGEPVPDPARPSGWGLYLVRELADRWGVDRAACTRVWFELDRERTA